MKQTIKVFLTSFLTLILSFNIALATLGLPSTCPPGFVGTPPFCVPVPPPPEPDPVIILHGIGASFNVDLFFNNSFGTEWIYFPGVNTYDNLTNAFIDAGYSETTNVFNVLYDWRQNNLDSATEFLIPAIDEVLSITGKSKVDIVAHSMGGLVARSYIQSDSYRDDVDQLVMLGTPNNGSSDSYLLWEGGKLPPDWKVGMKLAVGLYLNYLRAKDVSFKSLAVTVQNNIFSVKELLPVYDFLIDKDSGNPIGYKFMAHVNSVLENLNSDIGTLLSRVDVTNISGNNIATINQLSVDEPSFVDQLVGRWTDGKPNPNPPDKDSTEGDNRVLLSSSQIAGATQIVLNNGEHGSLPTLAQQDVIEVLTNSRPLAYFNEPDPDSGLAFMAASPVEIKVTDPLGRMFSKSINNIPGAEYLAETNPNGVKLIFIPEPIDGDYLVELTGIGSGGGYHLITSFADNSTMTDEVIAGDVEPDETIQYKTSFDESSQTPLQTELVDTSPPTIEIFSPEDGKKYLNSGNMEIDFEVSDDESGIGSSSAILDGEPVIDTEIIDLSLVGLEPHELKVEAEDNAGNSTESVVKFQTFATLGSLKNNLKHYWQLRLIKRFTAFIKLQAKLLALKHIINTINQLQTQSDSSPWYLKRALKQGINNLNNTARNYFNSFISQVRRGKGRKIDPHAADLLTEQAEYLRNKL